MLAAYRVITEIKVLPCAEEDMQNHRAANNLVANFKNKLLFAVTQVLDVCESPFIKVKQESELESPE